MAIRPIFIPTSSFGKLVEEIQISFKWHPGYALTQKQNNIESLHNEAHKLGFDKILEISTKSPNLIGKELSAFNLKFNTGNSSTCVENLYQSSKVFENGGPFKDLLFSTAKDARTDKRLTTSGNLIKFEFFGNTWGLLPRTAFYDWLYISAAHQQSEKRINILDYIGFSDIEFNPKKSINCQARSAAMFVSLIKLNLVEQAINDIDFFLSLYNKKEMEKSKQLALPI